EMPPHVSNDGTKPTRVFVWTSGRPSPVAGETALQIAWDGRLDNRDEVARLVGLTPAKAQGLSDSAIVLVAYNCWGDDLVHRLIGDWAFAIWDGVRGRLLCAKDPLGWRPLYYARHEGILWVATDPRTILRGGFPAKPNLDFAYRYLADAGRVAADTPYLGMSALVGGQRLTSESGTARIETYWSQPRTVERHYKNPIEYVEEFEDLVDTATRAMMRDGEEIGIYLSGGLDSSYIAAVAARYAANLPAISSYAPGTTADERTYQRAARAHGKLQGIELDIADCTALDQRYTTPDMFDTPEVPPQHSLHIATAQAAVDAGV